MCGSTAIDGYAFCLGLSRLEHLYKIPLDLQSLVRSVAYLIRGAIFRPKYASSWLGKFSLEIRPLGELIDMYHTRKATLRHDKVYALLGMCSDDLSAAGLSPDYTVSWEQPFRNLIKFLLYKEVSVKVWAERGIAVIKSRGSILGRVSLVENDGARYDRQNVVITFKNLSGHLGYKREWSTRWTLQASAKSIRQGDLVSLLQGASKPNIIRPWKDHFAIIVIAVTPQQDVRTESRYTKPQGPFHSINSFPRDFLLVWNWESSPGNLQDQEGYETSTEINSLLPEYSNTDLDKATRLRNVALILKDLEQYEEARERLREAIKSYGKVLGLEHPDTLISINNLASTYRDQGRWKEAEELEVQVMETRKRVLREEHPDTLTSMANLASTFWNQGRWKEAEELGV